MPDKKCPYCAETIKAEAVKCKHCGSDLMNPQGHDVSKAVEKGIRSEKTKESIGVFLLLGIVILSFVVGFTIHFSAGFIILFAGLYGVWRFYKS